MMALPRTKDSRCLAFVRLGVLVAVGLAAAGLVGVTPARAAEAGVPHWTVTAVSTPTNFTPGSESGQDAYKLQITNTGGAPSNGEPITITDTLPTGLTLNPAGLEGYELGGQVETQEKVAALDCGGRICTFTGSVGLERTLVVMVPVDVAQSLSSSSCGAPAGAVGCVTNFVQVSGGGAPDASVSTPTVISTSPAGFGIAPGSVSTSLSSTQAGAHADLTSTIGFDTLNRDGKLAGKTKEIVDELPPGFAGDLVDTPTCPVGVFQHQECPVETQIGLQTLTFAGENEDLYVYSSPVYNLAPEPGQLAKIGFPTAGGVANIQGYVTVTPGEYRLKTTFENIDNAVVELDSVSLTIWGVPTATIHDPWRWNGLRSLEGMYGASSSNPLVPYLTNPTSCDGESIQASISIYSWEAPQGPASSAQMPFGPLTGCDRLSLPASFLVAPTTQEAYAPTGLNAQLGVTQNYANAQGIASAHLNKAIVTLPEGMTVNPSAGAGLLGCTQAQYAAEVLETPAGQGCPNESKLGTVHIVAPAISEEAVGSVFLAQPYANPFSEPGHPSGSLLALYVIARIPNRGVIVKSAGKVEANPVTGRLTTVFENLPQLPFTTFTLSFRQGQTSPLVTPPLCGDFTASAELTPWSDLAETLSLQSPPIEIVHGFGGGACPSGGVPPFQPGLTAGTASNYAGSFSPFEIRITRNDGEQEITGFSSQLPPGLTANLDGVPFCSEADVALARSKTGAREQAEPSCPVASQIGHTLVGAGVGQVLAYAPGSLYLGGPFEGAPFSVVAITSATVGPFDLGTVVVHLPLDVNPVTAAVSIPAGAADQIPHIIDGIVVHVRDIRVFVDRPDFTINPTNCSPLGLSATVIGAGADYANPADADPVSVTDPFQAVNCARLAFKPTFTVSTSAKTSRADGASLRARLVYPSASLGTQANIAEVKVELPKQLPAKLTTLQHACPYQVFEANPAGCPSASRVGSAKATTPLIPAALEGPAYFVSYGGQQFPELILVLQGYGITIDLHGETFINEKTGITSSTFRHVPDNPVGSFELNLPEGRFSALAANANLCAQTLVMPTHFVAQNGAQISQSTPIAVTGCKPAIRVLRRSVKGGTATLTVSVPSAGRLRASGAGLAAVSKRLSRGGTTTISLAPSSGERRFLGRHPGRHLQARVRLLFTPTRGKPIAASVTLPIG